jgi:hypothetical protein
MPAQRNIATLNFTKKETQRKGNKNKIHGLCVFLVNQ